jgi:hypothetical protein
MELAIPALALGALYLVTNQTASSSQPSTYSFDREARNEGSARIEGYEGLLPNTDVPDANYPEDRSFVSADTDLTSQLSTVNKYDTPSVYTDKYFDPASIAQMNRDLANSRGAGGASQEYTSLTGDKVNAEYYQHNNMVPFFGSTLRTRLIDENSNEGLLDSMQGAGSQYISKTERAPLFSPSDNLQWAHGMPSFSDFAQSRVNPSNKISNVKPFEEIRVRPGLGRGSDAENQSLGFNSGMMAREMWMPKTADQMRVSNNPKSSGLSMLGHEGPAMSMVTNRGHHAPVEKNRPDRVAELDQTRYFATVGAAGAAGPLHGSPVDRAEENRATATMSYVGAAGRHDTDGHYVEGEYMPTHRIQLGEANLGPVSGASRTDAYDADYGAKSSKKYTNNRSTANVDDYFGIVGGALGAVVAPLLDVLRPSKKQNTVGTLRPYQNAESTVKNSYLLNPGDRPAPTIRETTERSNGHMFMNSGQERTAYMITKPMDIYTNRRDTTAEYGGPMGVVGAKEIRPYDAEYRQRNNENKSSTIAGRMVPGNMSLLQSDVNVRSSAGMESDLTNRRPAAPTLPFITPGMSQIGEVRGQQQLYGGMETDRSNAYVLSALKSNPYAIQPLTGY